MAKFQINGLFSTESYLTYALGIGPNDLTNFSICERINVEYFRGVYTNFFSYASHYADNSFVFDLRPRQSENEISLFVSGIKNELMPDEQGLFHYFPDIRIHKKWYHVCFTIRVTFLDSTTITSFSALYINGNLVQNGMICT